MDSGSKESKSQENMYPLVYINDIKIFTKNEEELESFKNNWNLQRRYRNGI